METLKATSIGSNYETASLAKAECLPYHSSFKPSGKRLGSFQFSELGVRGKERIL